MAPDERSQNGNRHRGVRNGLVAENRFVGERGDDLCDRTHGRQDHDVHGRVRIDPEEMLVQKRVAPLGRIENTDPEQRAPQSPAAG